MKPHHNSSRLTVPLLNVLLALTITLPDMIASGADKLNWPNPLLKQRADPHVFLHDGFYYLAASVPEFDRIELRRAKALGDLAAAEPKVIWKKHPEGVMGAHIWAPEIHFIDGKWYIYFAAGGAKDIWAIRMYALENASANPLEGEWVERGQMKSNWESFSLDATTFSHRGVRYFVWAQADPKIQANSCLYIARMDGPLAISGAQVKISQPEFPWERVQYNVNEGPAVLIRNGHVFMTYSASATDENYCLGLLTAREDADLLDPASWVKSKTPVFVTNAENKQFGPGHNCFTTSLDGKTDIIVYHARPYPGFVGDALSDPNRHARAQVVQWKPDGTPDFGVPVADGKYSWPP